MTRLTKYLIIIPALILTAMSAGCSHSDSFTISGDIKELADRPVKLVVYNSDSVKTLSATAAAGRFTIKGTSADYAIAVLSSMSSGPSVRFLVRNGDKLTLEGPTIDSLTISGSDPNEQIAGFLASNPGLFDGIYPSSPSPSMSSISPRAANKAIADYVDKEGTTVAAAFLIAAYYDPTIDPAASTALINRFTTTDETRSLLASISEAVKTNSIPPRLPAYTRSTSLPPATPP